ncbi:hypothetical protein SNE40_009364 [Patella caerulea]|uniref:Nudix hydrolase domain-containing protein n=1 Tax=Patella caerulea TaxID=87958 RepID=A0AAN8PQX7_PATCE
MDPDVSIMYCVRHSQFRSRNQIAVCLDNEYNRKSLPQKLDEAMEDVWKQRVDTNPKLFNGTKFRLDSVKEEDGGVVTINLGVTCYKEYLGTNWSKEPKLLQEYGREKYNNAQACLSDPLGVGSLVVTSDNYVIFLHRSKYCGEAPNLWDIPGGHAEPEELVGKKHFEEIDLTSMKPEAVVDEIFSSIIREIRDEVNIPESSLSKPKMIGIARNITSASRPSIEFYVQCYKSSSEILSLYKQGSQAEADESTNIKFVPLNRVVKLEENDAEFWNELAPSAKGCLILYRIAIDLYDEQKIR